MGVTLILKILVAVALTGGIATTIIVLRTHKLDKPDTQVVARPAPPEVLRRPTAEELRLLNGMSSVAPHQKGGMH